MFRGIPVVDVQNPRRFLGVMNVRRPNQGSYIEFVSSMPVYALRFMDTSSLMNEAHIERHRFQIDRVALGELVFIKAIQTSMQLPMLIDLPVFKLPTREEAEFFQKMTEC
jgi:hypothetical protein